jgi:thiol-disulfide isomerase/thioredoxin
MLGANAPAPEISGTNINPASAVPGFKLSTTTGRVVVAIFFAWWCSHCHDELTNLQSLWKTYQGKKVDFVAIHVDGDDTYAQQHGYPTAKDAAIAKLTTIGVRFPAIHDPTWAIFKPYCESEYGVPQLYVINKDHIINNSVLGAEPSATTYNSIFDALDPREPVDIEMVMDVSDTMNDMASAGISKLSAMKQASDMVVDYCQAQGLSSDRMGLVWFTDDVSAFPGGNALMPVGTNATILKGQIDAKTTGMCTAMGAGLQKAFDTLAAGTQRRFAILLTDGMQNIDPKVVPVGSHFEIIDTPATEWHCSGTHASIPPQPGVDIASYNTRVHTIGVGITAAYSSLLQDIADATGGTYLATNDPANDLSLLYFVDLCSCMAGGSPAVVCHASRTFNPAQCQSVERFSINRSMRKFTAILSWQKSCAGSMTFWLRAPDGSVVDLHSSMKYFDTYAMATVHLPLHQDGKEVPHTGEWQMIVRGETGSAPLYTAMIIGDDTGTHIELITEGRAYEVGGILPLKIQLKEENRYLTTPYEVVLQKMSMQVPLAELLAQYPYVPAPMINATGARVRQPARVVLESKIKALSSDPRFMELVRQKVTSHSLRKGSLECNISGNALTFPVALTEPGMHTFRFDVRYISEQNGPISRVVLVSVYVHPGAADPKKSTVARIPFGSGRQKGVMLMVTPRNSAGHLIGPGKKSEIRVLPGDKKGKYTIEDQLDGTYRVMIESAGEVLRKGKPFSLSFGNKVLLKE